MIFLMIIFAFAVGYATIIEDAHDTEAAKILVYNALWFEMMLVLLGINLIGGIINYKMWRKEKWAQLTFHAAFLFILLGAGISRTFGYEGIMQIEEGESKNKMYSAEPYLQLNFFKLKRSETGEVIGIDERPVRTDRIAMWMSEGTPRHNDFTRKFDLGTEELELNYNWYITNKVLDVVEGNGKGHEYILLKFSMDPRDTMYLKSGTTRIKGGIKLSFNDDSGTDALHFKNTNGGEVFIQTPYDMTTLDQTILRNGGSPEDAMDTLMRDTKHRLRPRIVHQLDMLQFWYASHFNDVQMVYRTPTQMEDNKKQGAAFLSLNAKYSGGQTDITIEGQADRSTIMRAFYMKDYLVNIGYGPKIVELPFYVHCKEFRLEKYDGSEQPSSYECDLAILDSTNGEFFASTVFMNNVLDYGGYRFFQSSYSTSPEGDPSDPDITVLSVNHDFWGTLVTYIGYILMTIGFIWALLKRSSRFGVLRKKVAELNVKRVSGVIVFGLLSLGAYGQEKDENYYSQELNKLYETKEIYTKIDEAYVESSERLLIQTPQGRISPFHTHALDLLRKVYKKDKYNGMSAQLVYISMLAHSKPWYHEKIIFVKHASVRDLLGIKGKYACLADFADPDFLYTRESKFKTHINDRYNQAVKTRDIKKSKYDKELIKTVERFHVLKYALIGQLFRVFPVEDEDNTWIAPIDLLRFKSLIKPELDAVVHDYFGSFYKDGIIDGNWDVAQKKLQVLKMYQKAHGGDVVPSDTAISMEILYNKMDIFKWLMIIYGTFGLIMIVILCFEIFIDSPKFLKIVKIISFSILTVSMIFHVFGLGLRWYVTGHAPWSNGYEALVFIGFATMLAGLIFYKYSRFTIGAGALLCGLILGIAHGSNVDPEMTNLVPVLKSYWLVIHVAIITASYGFLGLGAILSLVNIIVHIIGGANRSGRIRDKISELTYTSELTLTVGVYMAAIGTFLGGVWANESWGRYWGWDAKETWALVIVLVYSIILHFRFIPGLKQKLTFNVAAVFAFFTVIMTYFGVNYLLTKGLHSYARGSGSGIPNYIYIIVLVLVALTVGAYVQEKRYRKSLKK